jgi:glutaredoxin
MLNGAKANYEYINIHEDDEASQFVREVNGGYESVPTLLFPDGTTLTEPSAGALKAKLEASGYAVPLRAMLLANAPKLALLAIVVFFIARMLGLI